MPFNVKVLKVISIVCSFIYYFTDNVVWLSKIGFISKYIPFSPLFFGKPWKWGHVKD